MMKYKYRFMRTAFLDRPQLQAYLEKQAAKGWMLDQIGDPFWRFRRIEPKRLHFAITYFPDAVEFDPLPNHRQNRYQEFCAHAGWELAASRGQLQVFWNEQEDPVPIETDPAMELETIHKMAKKGTLPASGVLLGLCLLMLINSIRNMQRELIVPLGNDLMLATPVCLALLAVFLAAELVGYFFWYRKALKRAREWEELPPGSRGIRSMVILGLISILLLTAIWRSGGLPLVVFLLAMYAFNYLLYFAVRGLRRFLLRREVSVHANLAISIVVTVVLLAVFGNAVVNLIFGSVNAIFPKKEEPKLFIYNNMRLEVYDGEIPMDLADLGITLENSMELTNTYESVLLSRTVCMEGTREERFEEALFYNVIDVKYDWLMDPVLEDLWNMENDYNMRMVYGRFIFSLRPMEPGGWGADEAWEGLDYDGAPASVYLLRYGSRIVTLELREEPDAGQMATVGEIFG